MSPETRVVCPSNALEARRGNPCVLRLDQPPGRLDDLNETVGQLEIAKLEIAKFETGKRVRRQPFEVVEFLVEDDLVGRPARRKRHDQIMAAGGGARAHLAPACQAYDLHLPPRFLVDLALQRGMQGFTEFDRAAGQRIEALGRRSRAPHQENLVVAKDGRADRELRMLGWKTWRRNGLRHQCVMMYSTSPSEPPLMMPPAAD